MGQNAPKPTLTAVFKIGRIGWIADIRTRFLHEPNRCYAAPEYRAMRILDLCGIR